MSIQYGINSATVECWECFVDLTVLAELGEKLKVTATKFVGWQIVPHTICPECLEKIANGGGHDGQHEMAK